jgi:cytochrome c oxidase subunit 1/cytochrome c oxidase subunit I+III
MILGNLVWSRMRGPLSGPDPFYGGTLEWATSSPPPPYNFPVIPEVRSPYPNWDTEDRDRDRRRLERGQLVLEEGHETPATTVRDGILDEVLEMPGESWWPLVTAACIAGIFAFLLTDHFAIAGIVAGLAALAAVAWHSQEPEEPQPV